MLQHRDMPAVFEYVHAHIRYVFRRDLGVRHRYDLVLPALQDQHGFGDGWKFLYNRAVQVLGLAKKVAVSP